MPSATSPSSTRMAKLHGLGNDFLVVVDLDGASPVAPATAVRLCERRTGVGADGVLHVDGDLRMTLHNADGSRAEMSGNGIRCLAHALARSQGVERATYDIITDVGPRRVEIELADGGRTAWSTADMGVLRAAPARDPGLGAEASMGVDVGNPHLVARFRDERAIGVAIDRIDDPSRNVELVAVEAPDRLVMRVIERGVGETRACGTGATAAAWAAREWGLVGDRVTVAMPGGEAVVDLGPTASSPVRLSGPSEWVADVEVPDLVLFATSGATNAAGAGGERWR